MMAALGPEPGLWLPLRRVVESQAEGKSEGRKECFRVKVRAAEWDDFKTGQTLPAWGGGNREETGF